MDPSEHREIAVELARLSEHVIHQDECLDRLREAITWLVRAVIGTGLAVGGQIAYAIVTAGGVG